MIEIWMGHKRAKSKLYSYALLDSLKKPHSYQPFLRTQKKICSDIVMSDLHFSHDSLNNIEEICEMHKNFEFLGIREDIAKSITKRSPNSEYLSPLSRTAELEEFAKYFNKLEETSGGIDLQKVAINTMFSLMNVKTPILEFYQSKHPDNIDFFLLLAIKYIKTNQKLPENMMENSKKFSIKDYHDSQIFNNYKNTVLKAFSLKDT